MRNKILISLFVLVTNFCYSFNSEYRKETYREKTYYLEALTKTNSDGISDLHLKVYINNKVIRNNKLIVKFDSNCSAEGYSYINHYYNEFSIEQSFCQDFFFVNSIATFKILTNKVILKKYKENYTDRSNPEKIIPSKTWDSNNFGKVYFENVNSDFFLKLHNRKNFN